MTSVLAYVLVILSANMFAEVKTQNDAGNACDKLEVVREFVLCLDNSLITHFDYFGDCSAQAKMLDCSIKINTTCSNEEWISQIKLIKQGKEFCEHVQMRIDNIECRKKTQHCINQFDKLFLARKYPEARVEIDQAKKCLARATCKEEKQLEKINEELDDVLEIYKTGVLTGKCGVSQMEKCVTIVYNGVPEPRQYVPFSTKCNLNTAKAATKCMEDLKPNCVSEKQEEYYGRVMEFIEGSQCASVLRDSMRNN